MLVQIIIILLLTLLNGFFAMCEIALVSARKARLQQRAANGDARAAVALQLANAPDRFLSTVQVAITLIGILAGAYGGALIAQELAEHMRTLGPLALYADAVALGAVVVVITFLSLVLGELVPKRLGLAHAEAIAIAVARPMRGLSTVAAPIVAVLSVSSSLVLRLLGGGARNEPPVSQEEIKIMLDQGAEAGVFEKKEHTIVTRVFRMGDRRVNSLMTPRTDIIWIDAAAPLKDNLRKMAEAAHSYFPICRGSIDEVLGMASVKELWARLVAGQKLDLQTGMRPPQFVPESMPAFKLLELFESSGQHVALVIDEYGGIIGLVTLNDVMEAIVGDFPGGSVEGDADIVQRGDGSWLIDGMTPTDRLKELFGVSELPGEDIGDYQTMGGFVMSALGRIPSVPDTFEAVGHRFEIVDMDGHRVDKVLVSKLPEPAAAGSESSR